MRAGKAPKTHTHPHPPTKQTNKQTQRNKTVGQEPATRNRKKSWEAPSGGSNVLEKGPAGKVVSHNFRITCHLETSTVSIARASPLPCSRL